jgi:hypothetical protein
MRTLLAIVVIALAVPAFAAAPTPPPPGARKLQKIRALLSLTRADQAGQNMLVALRAQLPPAQYADFEKRVNPEEIVERFVEVYDRHFSEADIDALAAFYGTPLGQKLLAESPAIAQESIAIGQKYALEKLNQARAAPGAPAK